ncbi:MAG: hypothetical protein L0287_10010 [Anaerolineae bacterium]|nr:hypothetical protein [Anaerolineae bacterium]
MKSLETLQQDHAVIQQIIEARRADPTDEIPVGARILLNIYLHILEDALATLSSLIQYFNSKTEGEAQSSNAT